MKPIGFENEYDISSGRKLEEKEHKNGLQPRKHREPKEGTD